MRARVQMGMGLGIGLGIGEGRVEERAPGGSNQRCNVCCIMRCNMRSDLRCNIRATYACNMRATYVQHTCNILPCEASDVHSVTKVPPRVC